MYWNTLVLVVIYHFIALDRRPHPYKLYSKVTIPYLHGMIGCFSNMMHNRAVKRGVGLSEGMIAISLITVAIHNVRLPVYGKQP